MTDDINDDTFEPSTSGSWVVSVEEGEDGELVLPLPNELMTAMGWTAGDHLSWDIGQDGSIVLSKS